MSAAAPAGSGEGVSVPAGGGFRSSFVGPDGRGVRRSMSIAGID